IPTGVIWSNADHWYHMKKFTLSALKEFGIGSLSLEERIREEAKIVVRMLRRKRGTPIDMEQFIPKAVSNIISGIVFGNRFDYDDPDFNMLLDLLNFLFKHAGYNRPENLFPILENMPFSKIGQIMENQGRFETYVKGQILRHKNTYDPCVIRDFIDLYIQREYDEKQDDITETSSTTLLWIILYMIRYPMVQTKCRAEIRRVIGGSKEISMSDKENMPYVTATINEIQRVASIGPRSCLGKNLAEMELFLIMVTLLRNFNFTSVVPHEKLT
ncbi:hypothetical protein FSP39_012331, partial [Pinctada imbricata]